MAGEVAQDEEEIGGPLGEAAHEVGVPGVAVGDVEAEAVAGGDEHALQVAADAVEHLKLEGGGAASGAGGMFDDDVDHAGVVGGEGGVLALVEHETGEAGVAGVDVAFSGPCDGVGFLVCALAEADGDAEGVKAAEVVVGAVEVGLEDGAKTVVGGVEVFDDAKGGVDVLAGLHVDFDAGADGAGLEEDGFDVGAAEGVRDVKAELSELDGDGGVQGRAGDGVEGILDAGAGGFGFFTGCDVLAKVIEGGQNAFLLEAEGDGDDVFEAAAGDEAAGEAGGGGGSFHPPPEGAAAGEEEKRFSQHTGLIPFYGIRCGAGKGSCHKS